MWSSYCFCCNTWKNTCLLPNTWIFAVDSTCIYQYNRKVICILIKFEASKHKGVIRDCQLVIHSQNVCCEYTFCRFWPVAWLYAGWWSICWWEIHVQDIVLVTKGIVWQRICHKTSKVMPTPTVNCQSCVALAPLNFEPRFNVVCQKWGMVCNTGVRMCWNYLCCGFRITFFTDDKIPSFKHSLSNKKYCV